MLIRIDPASALPLFEQVATAVRAEVVAGRVGPGDRLPAARAMADALGINVHTVLHAYQLLRAEGIIDLRRGRGAVVSAHAAPLVELHDDVLALVARAETLGVSASALASLVTTSRPRKDPIA